LKIPLYIFEDAKWKNFGPVASLRPVWDLRVGLETLAERISRKLSTSFQGYLPRPSLNKLVSQSVDGLAVGELPERGDVLIVNGRNLGEIPKDGLKSRLRWTLWLEKDSVVAARIPVDVAKKWWQEGQGVMDSLFLKVLFDQFETPPEINVFELEDCLVSWPWELIHRQGAIIHNALSRVGDGNLDGNVHHQSILVEESNMHIGEGATIAAGAILDASAGPIIIEKNVKVMPGAIIIGPVAIGRNSMIKPGAKLHGPLTIGPVCKIGGEVEDSIIQGYSNKQHEGFLGHAIVGEWVNLGADTNNSDLKNNYSPISVVLNGEVVNTGETFFGCLLGDHVKTAINTQLNTGTVAGIGSNIFGAGFPPKVIGDFCWGGAEGFQNYDFEKFLVSAKAAMDRRDVELTETMIELLKDIHSRSLH